MVTPPPNMLRVTCHVSRVTCHVSGVTCQVSHVTFFFGEANRWRVCYQRGLPRLVCYVLLIFIRDDSYNLTLHKVHSMTSINNFYKVYLHPNIVPRCLGLRELDNCVHLFLITGHPDLQKRKNGAHK